jgi:ABC-type branched-subunit amino acid transport system ATPase component
MKLVVSTLHKRFAGVVAVRDLTFTAEPGRITALIGPNGAGKTTALSLISGFIPADSGRVELDGTDVTRLAAHAIAGYGLARTYQNLQVFEELSALEVVMVGCHRHLRPNIFKCLVRRGIDALDCTAEAQSRVLLARVGVPEDQVEREARDLPYGMQRRVEIARALASQPRVLLLDEPAAGLNANETREVAVLVRSLRDDGLTVVLIEHDMDMVMSISDEVVVMNYGTCIATGTPSEVQRNPQVLQAYLGDTEVK